VLASLAALAAVSLFIITARDDSTAIGIWVQTVLENPVPPPIAVPAQKPPTPNAFDDFVKAGKALVDEKQIRKGTSGPAAKKLLARNAMALALVRHGFTHQFQTPRTYTRDESTPLFKKAVRLSLLIRMESDVKRADGDAFAAANCTLDYMEFGSQLMSAGQVDLYGIGRNIEATALKSLWDDIDHLNAKEARSISTRLEQIFSRQISCADSIQEQCWAFITMIQHHMKKDMATESIDDAKRITEFMTRKLSHYQDYYQQAIANARLPYRQQKPLPRVPSGINDLLPADTVEALRGMPCTFTGHLTRERLLVTALALRAYQIEHRKYPASLKQLVPAYLPELPDDPFIINEPLHYQLHGVKYLLYSVGPDCRDDGGKAIKEKIEMAGSKGDLIAVVNK